jgi:hypothetical protein
MAAVVNDRDVLIMATVPRFTPPTDRGLFLSPPAAVFKLSANGLSASPSQFKFAADLLNLAGTVSFSWTGGMNFVVNGNEATLDFANFAAVSGVLTATITVDGVTYTKIATVTKLSDGAAGQTGARGTIDISVATSGSIWSDAEAVAAVAANGFGAPRSRDIVNLYKADRTWAQRRIYDGATWQVLSDVFDAIYVKGSVLADAIDSRGLSIKDVYGNVILSAGTSLAVQTQSNPNLVPRVDQWVRGGEVQWIYYDGTSPYARDGYHMIFRGAPEVGNKLSLFNTAPMTLSSNSAYTLSFTADGGAGDSTLICDLIPDNLPETSFVIRAGINEYTTTWTTGTQAELLGCILRIFTGNQAQQIAVFNVKFEKGPKQTAWCDSVITAANASTFIASAAIKLAMIDRASIGSLSAISANIGLLRTADYGGRMEIENNVQRTYDENNNLRMLEGRLY